MQIPRFWKRAAAKVTGHDGKPWKLPRWGWSANSAVEAETMAETRARNTEQKWTAGRFQPTNWYQPGFYEDLPPREEIIDEVADSLGNTQALVTRNAYGSLVLNTDRMLIIDVDQPQNPNAVGSLIKKAIGVFFSRAAPPAEIPQNVLPQNLREALNQSTRQFRVYQTAAGWRLIMCDAAIGAVDKASLEIMRQFPVDQQYLRLCERQKTCRARLTPKSWRVGLERPRYRYPFDSAPEKASMAKWSDSYLKAIEGHATCRLLEGHDLPIAPELAQLIELHDQLSGVDSEAPLA